MSWAHLVRFELRGLFVIVLIIAAWWGFNFLSPWLAEIGILIILSGGFAFLIFANRVLFGGWLAAALRGAQTTAESMSSLAGGPPALAKTRNM